MSPIPSNRYDEAISAIGIIKKVTEEKRQGGGIHPPGRPSFPIFPIFKGGPWPNAPPKYATTTRMYNASIRQGHLPVSQKEAIVTPILKKSDLDPSDVKNYRPISQPTVYVKGCREGGPRSALRSPVRQ